MSVITEVDRIANEVFLPDAAAVDREGRIPDTHFEALARAKLYGAFVPAELGGADLRGNEMSDAIERLASGCLASTFVWIQHFGLLGSMLDPSTPAELRERLLQPLIKGEMRAGIALAGQLPNALLRASKVPSGWRLSGESPWVSGWGYVHLLQVVARIDETHVVTVVIDAREGAGLSCERLHLTAANASNTVRLSFGDMFVPDDRVVRVREFDPVRAQAENLRGNGSLALGIIRRCCAILGPSLLDDELNRCRRALDEASVEQMPVARANASALAVKAAAAVTVAHGSAASLVGSDADRLLREAAFTLVFGSRPSIKSALREMLSPSTRE